MANYASSGQSAHRTTAANVEDVVTLNAGYPYVQITNWDPINFLWVTLATGKANQVDPTAVIDNDFTYKLGPGGSILLADDAYVDNAQANTRVHLNSTAAVAYSVTGFTS